MSSGVASVRPCLKAPALFSVTDVLCLGAFVTFDENVAVALILNRGETKQSLAGQ